MGELWNVDIKGVIVFPRMVVYPIFRHFGDENNLINLTFIKRVFIRN